MGKTSDAAAAAVVMQHTQPAPYLADTQPPELEDEASMSDLEILARALGLQGNASLIDVKRSIWELRQTDRSGSGVTPLAGTLHREDEI